MSLNNRISCVVGIYIFGFNTYWKRVFNLTETKTTPTFKQFLQSKTISTKKNKSYYQWYDVKLLRAFHKQAMIKQWIYENILARRSGMDYSPGIKFQTSLINMDGSKAPTISNKPENNQQKQCWCGSIKNLRVTSKDCPVGLAIRKAKHWPWVWGYLNSKKIRQQKMQQKRKRENVWRQRPLRRVKNKMRGYQQEIWYKIWMLSHMRQLRMGISNWDRYLL